MFLRWVNWRVSPGGTWGEADAGRRHQGQARSSAACRAQGLLPQPASPLPPQAAILQQTAEYIFSLEQEKTRLLQQNTQLKRFIQVVPRGWDSRGWDNPGCSGGGCHCSSLGSGWDPLHCSAREWRYFHSPGRAGSPVQPGISYLAGGEGLGSHFPLFPPIWGVGNDLVAVLVLGCPG